MRRKISRNHFQLFHTFQQKFVIGGHYHLHSIFEQVEYYMDAIYCVIELSVQWLTNVHYIYICIKVF